MVNFQHLSLEHRDASKAVNAVLAYLEGDDYDSQFKIAETDNEYTVYWGDTDKLTVEEMTTQQTECGTDGTGGDAEVFIIEGTEREIRDVAERD